MLDFVYGSTSSTQTVVGGTLGDILVLDLPGDPLHPQDWVFLVSGQTKVYDSGATSADVRSDVRISLNGSDLLRQQYLHRNDAGTFSQLGFCSVVWLRDHSGFLTGGSHQTYSTLKVRAAANTTDSAGSQIDLANVRILGIRVPKDVVGAPWIYQATATTAIAGTSQAVYGASTWTPTRGRYLVLSTAQLSLAAGTGTVDLKLLVSETRNSSSEIGATTQEVKRIPACDNATGSAALGHLTHTEDAAVSQKIPVTALAVVDLWETPTSISWLVDYAGTAAGTQLEQVWSVALPLDGNFEYSFVEYPGSKINSTTTYSPVITGFPFGADSKNSYLLYQAFVTKSNAGGDLECAVFPTGTTSGAHGYVFAQSLGLALETVYLQGCQKFSGVSSGVDCSFREATASAGSATINHAVFLALIDRRSIQSEVTGSIDIPLLYGVEAFESTNPVGAATTSALQIVSDSAEPVGVRVTPVVVSTDKRATNLSASDTLLTG